jgi:hypothetical protein
VVGTELLNIIRRASASRVNSVTTVDNEIRFWTCNFNKKKGFLVPVNNISHYGDVQNPKVPRNTIKESQLQNS